MTVVEGSDPVEGVQNFADYCIDSTAEPTSVPSLFSVENGCSEDKTFVIDITDASGAVNSTTITLNAASSDWIAKFDITRPSTAVITHGSDVVTLDYPEYSGKLFESCSKLPC